MVFVALAVWVVATVVVGVPVALLLRRIEPSDTEELVDPVELGEAMGRHPSRRQKVA
jgi:hypothetical protein